MVIAPDTLYGLVGQLRGSGVRVDVHLLLRFAVCALNGHYDVAFARHRLILSPEK